MHAALTALTDELKRLKAGGMKNVVVSNASLVALKQAIDARKPKPPPGQKTDTGAGTGVASNAPTKPPEQPRVYSQLRQPAPKPPPPKPEPKLPPPPTVTIPEGDKKTRWDALLNLVTTDAECVKHVRPGKKVVLGVGNLDAKIFFCGEAPGEEEEIKGEPFVGPAGQLLTKMIQAMGVKREDVYIGNIMNWRPELPISATGGVQVGNRPPTEEEIRYCMPYLRAQLEIVAPEIIVALGSTAAQGLLGFGSFKTLGEIRGKWQQFDGKPVMVTYHPSYILRTPTNRTKRAVWEDFLKAMERVALPISEKQRGFFLG